MGRGKGYITAADGQAICHWVDGGVPVDPVVEQWRGALLNECEKGVEALRAKWGSMPKGMGGKLGVAFRDQCAASAAAYDQQRLDAQQTVEDNDGAFNALNDAAAQQSNEPQAPAPQPDPVPEPEPEAQPAPAPAAAADDQQDPDNIVF